MRATNDSPLKSPLPLSVRRPGALLTAALAVAALSLVTLPASAKPEVPGRLQTLLEKKAGKKLCTPTCLLCHTDPAGGTDYVRDPRAPVTAWYAVAYGEDEAGFNTLADRKADSDMDGVADYDELVAGTDPFAASNASICSPLYGCGARIAPASSSNRATTGAAAIFAAAVATYLVRRPRRKR